MWDDRASVNLAAWRANFIASENSVFILAKGYEEKVEEFFSQRQVIGHEAVFPCCSLLQVRSKSVITFSYCLLSSCCTAC